MFTRSFRSLSKSPLADPPSTFGIRDMAPRHSPDYDREQPNRTLCLPPPGCPRLIRPANRTVKIHDLEGGSRAEDMSPLEISVLHSSSTDTLYHPPDCGAALSAEDECLRTLPSNRLCLLVRQADPRPPLSSQTHHRSSSKRRRSGTGHSRMEAVT